MKNKRVLGVLGILALTVLTMSAYPREDNVIQLGSIGILTGQGASWGLAAKNGIDLAVEEINNNGGINGKQLIVTHEDDQGDAKYSINAYTKLTQAEGINLIVGTSWSNTGLPLVDLADNDQVLMISPSLGKPEFNEGSNYLFNTWPHDVILSAQLADYVIEKGHTNIALIGAEQLWVKDQTNAFTKRFEELGGTIEVLVEPLPTDRELNTEALKIKNARATAIVSTTDGVLVGALVAKRAAEIGVDLPMYSITIDADAIKSAEGAYEDMEFLTFLTPTKEFKEIYEEGYGPIDIGADSAYDAVMLMAQAMEETETEDPTVLAEYLNGVEEYNGASGHLISDGKGGFEKELALMKVIDGVAILQ